MPRDRTAALRILDASLNRAAEALRVCEDYVRFALDDAHLTEQLKWLRHDLANQAQFAGRCDARDTPRDVGTQITAGGELNRGDLHDVCRANFERAKQSFRSLEEFSKVISAEAGRSLERLRYRLYAIEAAVVRTADALNRLESARLCVLVDGRESPSALARLTGQLVAAGAGMIQLRDKGLDDRALIERGKAVVATTRGKAVTIINDRSDIAAAVNADGVHLGQDDLSVKDARRVVGPGKLIGVSTHSIEQARGAVLDGANYLGAGPVFPSQTKTFREFPGLGYLREVAREIRLPTFAIGGIDAVNLASVLETGVTRVAAGSAITAATSPRQTASEMISLLGSAS